MKEVKNLEKSKCVMNIKGCDILSTMYHDKDADDDEDERVCQPANNKLHVGLWQSRVISEAGHNQTTLNSSFYLSTLI